MRTFFLLFCCMLSAAAAPAQQICKPNSILASTPTSQLIDNGDGTITDNKTGLMWKKCLEGISGSSCESGVAGSFTWQKALQQANVVNSSGGFAGHTDWRLPNINELVSIVEEQCSYPAINLNRFSNISRSGIWSGSPFGSSGDAWYVSFRNGLSSTYNRNGGLAVLLVRGGY